MGNTGTCFHALYFQPITDVSTWPFPHRMTGMTTFIALAGVWTSYTEEAKADQKQERRGKMEPEKLSDDSRISFLWRCDRIPSLTLLSPCFIFQMLVHDWLLEHGPRVNRPSPAFQTLSRRWGRTMGTRWRVEEANECGWQSVPTWTEHCHSNINKVVLAAYIHMR